MVLGAAVLFALVSCPPAPPQDASALRALVDVPGIAIEYAFDPAVFDSLLVGARAGELRDKADGRSLAEDLELIDLSKDANERRRVAEGALGKQPSDGDRLLLLLVAGRYPEAVDLGARVPPVGLESLRGRLALAGAGLDSALADALGPLGMEDIRQNPMAIATAGRMLGADRDKTLDAIEAAKHEIDAVASSIAALREAAPKDIQTYRLWLSARNAQVLAEVAAGLLGPPVPDPLAQARAQFQAVQRVAFDYAKEAGDLRAMVEAVMRGVLLSGGGSLDADAAKALRAHLGEVSARAASGSSADRLAAALVDGSMRFAVLGDDAGALASLMAAWRLAAEGSPVRKSIAGPIVLLQIGQKTWDAGLAFLAEARGELGVPTSLQLEAKYTFAKGEIEGTVSALARLDDPERSLWRDVASAAVATRRAKDGDELRAIAEAFVRPLAIAFAGSDEDLQSDALFLAGILAALTGDRQRAVAAAAMLRVREGGSERILAFEKALG